MHATTLQACCCRAGLSLLLLLCLARPPPPLLLPPYSAQFEAQQVTRFLVSIEASGLPVTLALNKADLVPPEVSASELAGEHEENAH